MRRSLEPRDEPREELLERGVVGHDHHEDEHDGVDEHAPVGDGTQELGQDGQHRGRDDRAADVAHATQNHEHQDENRQVEVKLLGNHGREVHCIERAGGTGKRRRDDEGDEAVLGDVDAHRLGGDAVVANGHDGAARARVHDVEHHGHGDDHEDDAGQEGRDLLDAHRALRAIDDDRSALHAERLGVGHREVQTARVKAHIEVVEDVLDDLAEGQGHDGEVVAMQAHDRDADEEPGERRAGRRDDEAQDEQHRHARDSTLEHGDRHDAREGTHAHEAGMAEGQLAGDSHDEVEGDGHAHVGADGHELAGERVR